MTKEGGKISQRSETLERSGKLNGSFKAKAGSETTSQADQWLIQQISDGDQAALERLYDQYQGTVFAVAQRVLQREADAEEVVLEIFWQMWKRPDRYDPNRGTLVTYLVLLARSRALDKLRSRQSVKHSATTVPDMEQDVHPANGEGAPSPNEVVDLQEQRAHVREAMETLSDVQRQALELAFFEPLTHEQIAERLGVPLGTIKTRIRQGLIRLRGAMREARTQ